MLTRSESKVDGETASVTEYEYDEFGAETHRRSVYFFDDGDSVIEDRTENEHYADDTLKKSVEYDEEFGSSFESDYAEDGRLTAQHSYREDGSLAIEYEYAYHESGLPSYSLRTEYEEDGAVGEQLRTVCLYNGDSLETERRYEYTFPASPGGGYTFMNAFRFDENDRRVMEIGYFGEGYSPELVGVIEHVYLWAYDDEGNIIRKDLLTPVDVGALTYDEGFEFDAGAFEGYYTAYERDAHGNLVRSVSSRGTVTENTYEAVEVPAEMSEAYWPEA